MSQEVNDGSRLGPFELDQVHHADVVKALVRVPAKSVHTAICSPPYWGPRSYEGVRPTLWPAVKYSPMPGLPPIGIPAQRALLGQEPDPFAFVGHMVRVFRSVRRVLRDDGCAWVNLGDSSATGAGNLVPDPANGKHANWHSKRLRPGLQVNRQRIPGVKKGDWLLMPHRVAMALQADGWWVRSAVVWAKSVSFCDGYVGSVMPESMNGWEWMRCQVLVNSGGKRNEGADGAYPGKPRGPHSGSKHTQPAEWEDCPGCKKCDPNDGWVLRKARWRPTHSHEMVFLLAKSSEYFGDPEAVKEIASKQTHPRKAGENGDQEQLVLFDGEESSAARPAGVNPKAAKTREESKQNESFSAAVTDPVEKRNLRNVWTIRTSKSGANHYAAYSERLVEPMIEVSTPEKGVCPHCGVPWSRVTRKTNTETPSAARSGFNSGKTAKYGRAERGQEKRYLKAHEGWAQSCTCPPHEPEPAVVLDPFAGTGTTLVAAIRLGRRGLGFDLSRQYVEEISGPRLLEARAKGTQLKLL